MTAAPRPQALAACAALALASACARPLVKVDHPQWPAAPAPALVVYQGGFPDERSFAGSTSWFRKVLDAVFGITEEARLAKQQSLLSRPFGLAVQGPLLYVADPDGHQVLVVKWQEGTFEPLACPSPWGTPMAVATTADGVVYVADSARARVVRVEKGACSEFGEGLQRPVGLAVSKDKLYVVDALAHGVVVFGLAGGREVARFGTRGEGAGELNFPTAIATRGDGALLLIDALNFRVVAYSPQGEVLASFGKGGDEEGDFARPKAVAVDRRGRVYVSDAQYGVVLIFDPEGKWQMAFGGSGRDPRSFSLPAGLAIGGSTLFVADAYHHRVEFYDLLEVPTP